MAIIVKGPWKLKRDELVIKASGNAGMLDPIGRNITVGFKLTLRTRIKLLFANGIYSTLTTDQQMDLMNYFTGK